VVVVAASVLASVGLELFFLVALVALAFLVVDAPFTFAAEAALTFGTDSFTTLALASTTGVCMRLLALGVGVVVHCQVPSSSSSAQA
jgi:hypothetical protein